MNDEIWTSDILNVYLTKFGRPDPFHPNRQWRVEVTARADEDIHGTGKARVKGGYIDAKTGVRTIIGPTQTKEEAVLLLESIEKAQSSLDTIDVSDISEGTLA